jgi:hypothetical protein
MNWRGRFARLDVNQKLSLLLIATAIASRLMAFQSFQLPRLSARRLASDVKAGRFAFEGLRSWHVDSETVVGLQLTPKAGQPSC